ncbi:MAG: NFACT family protein, partial [Oscillospiraceae bacterium]|nr:NFACT family protein [Oscillospiraceae bacterium]
MPFDAVLLRAVRQELQSRALGAKIDKVQQPERDAIVLQLRSMGGGGRLLLCASPNRARIHFTEAAMENPSAPPMFCMLLRKHLVGGKLVAIEQPEMERALTLHLECTDEMGEPTQKRLIVELMGRNSNVILVDAEGRIVDALRRVDYEMSEKRQVLPGLFYHEPPQQEKLDPLALEPGALSGMLQAVRDPIQADKWLLDHFAGLSPLVCRELSWRFCARTDADLSR